jgi:hypothetical protein
MTSADASGNPTYGNPFATADSVDVKVAMGRTNAEMAAALGGRAAARFAPYQRSLCNKCHAKD